MSERIALFGGVYNNHLALAAALDDARHRGVDRFYCLGDLGAFGPFPDRVFPLLFDANVACVQGNYDHSIGYGMRDCQCGYTDPRDNHFAQLSYDYTDAKTSARYRPWLRSLPRELRFDFCGQRVLLCHGSPRRTNEFLWESTTSTAFLNRLADEAQADVICGTHTGLHWERRLDSGKQFINVGVLGRPENDGTPRVWYTVLSTNASGQGIDVEFVPLEYDHERLAQEMRVEDLPNEFVETILTGWWTTCLEILPSKERRRGRY